MESRRRGNLPAYTLAGQSGASSEEVVERGEKLFANACAICHSGEERMRRGDSTTPSLLTLFSDQALRRIIITGRPDLGMPSFADEEWPRRWFSTADVAGDQ